MPDQEVLTRVAQIYREAAAVGAGQAVAVSTALGIPMATANSWIRRAKDRGLLAEDQQARTPKAVRVAAALGVEYDALVAAIREHANGRIAV